jgi:hypothetical protein
VKNSPKTILTVLLGGMTTCGLFCQHVQATPALGAITFAATASLDSNSAGAATMVTAWHGLGSGGLPQVMSHDGGFDGFVTNGDAVTFHAPWFFNSGAISSFWAVDGFVFDLIASTVAASPNSNSVTVDGTGTISGHGFASTPGVWHFTTQNPAANGQFSFSAASGTVPDGGSAVALLGIALVGIETLRRTLRAK